jgi:hypothetical protein
MQNLIQAPVKRECIEWMGGGGWGQPRTMML